MSNEYKRLYSWQLEDVRDKIRDSSWSEKEIETNLKKIDQVNDQLNYQANRHFYYREKYYVINRLKNWLWVVVGIYTLRTLIDFGIYLWR